MHFSLSMLGSPASFMAMMFMGQELSQRAPQAMHLPSMIRALPRGFLIGFFASVMFDAFITAHSSGRQQIPAQQFFQQKLRGPFRVLQSIADYFAFFPFGGEYPAHPGRGT